MARAVPSSARRQDAGRHVAAGRQAAVPVALSHVVELRQRVFLADPPLHLGRLHLASVGGWGSPRYFASMWSTSWCASESSSVRLRRRYNDASRLEGCWSRGMAAAPFWRDRGHVVRSSRRPLWAGARAPAVRLRTRAGVPEGVARPDFGVVLLLARRGRHREGADRAAAAHARFGGIPADILVPVPLCPIVEVPVGAFFFARTTRPTRCSSSRPARSRAEVLAKRGVPAAHPRPRRLLRRDGADGPDAPQRIGARDRGLPGGPAVHRGLYQATRRTPSGSP